ncbi:MAG: 4Fe-4S dicluster domain-containing protein [Acidobacteria bacterium]|nr:4Fe-4S dicluster domain-containing protein [Acidobacteriota bacterium]MCA1610122.1 4Fe-4S dicluster domain-containing protein [Acidobacteriota bacterium]
MHSIPAARTVAGLPGRVVFGALVAIAILAFVYSVARRIRVLLAGAPENRFDRIPLRIRKTIEYAFAQKRMFRDLYAGVFHILIFGGFVVLVVRSLSLVVEGLVPGFVLLPGAAGNAYTLVKDVFEVLVLVGVAMAVFRRAFARPARLDLTLDAWFILFLIALLMATDLLADGARSVLNPSAFDLRWSPAVAAVSRAFRGTSPAALQAVYEACWWIHLADLLFFANYLPYSKHFHILASVPNIFLMKLEPMGRLGTPDLENSERFGVSTVEDLSWKSMLDGYTCTECGRCRVVCPTALTGKPLDPRVFIATLRDAVYDATPEILAAQSGRGGDGPAAPRKDLIGGWVTEDTIWACTTCGYCTSACPVFIIPAVDKIIEMRRHLVLEKAEFPKEMQTAFRGMETNGNPWGIAASSRADWAKDLPVMTMAEAEGSPVDVLFWVGCAGSYEDRAKKVSRALVDLLTSAGVRFAILGTEETCNGDSARRMGNEYLFQILAQQNVETMNGYGIKKIVTNCPHCFNVIKNEYPPFGGRYEVLHGTELVSSLIAEGRIRLENRIDESITFHDPCYLGRYNDVYDAPRQILEAIPGLRLQELARTKQKGLCCGAGGGRMWMEEKIGARINQTRMQEIAEAKTDSVGVSCPFCMVMIGNAREELGVETKPFDVLELARRSSGQGLSVER